MAEVPYGGQERIFFLNRPGSKHNAVNIPIYRFSMVLITFESLALTLS